MTTLHTGNAALRRVVGLVALLNLGYFGVEFAVALAIGSVSLFADSVDFHSGSLTRAAFLSARNDALANVAIIVTGLVTAFVWRSAWPDLIVGLGIAAMNADAAREVWEAACEEHRALPRWFSPAAYREAMMHPRPVRPR
jgi:Co/Zn/Cd efflux system component